MTTKSIVIAAACVVSGWLGGRLTAPEPLPNTSFPEAQTPAPAQAELVDATISPQQPAPPPAPAAEPCVVKETIKTVYVQDPKAVPARVGPFEAAKKKVASRPPYRELKWMALRPYREFRDYRAYKSDEKAAGSERDCQNHIYDSKCTGTVAFCTREPNAPECKGTRAFCLRNKRDRTCWGTEVFCADQPHHKACVATQAACLENSVRPECAGMLDFCTKFPLDDSCYGTVLGCSRGAFDQDICTPEEP